MKLFCTGSSSIVNECRVYFNCLPLRYQIRIRTAHFFNAMLTVTIIQCAGCLHVILTKVCFLFLRLCLNYVDQLLTNVFYC